MRGNLFKAAMEGNTKTLLQILNDESDITVRNKAGNQALIYAAWKGHTDMVHMLCNLGVDVNYQASITQKTPIMFAARWGHVEIVKQLIASGANLELTNKEGGKAIDYALRGGDATTISLLKDTL